jgi:predicted transcriptional regulator
MRAVLSVSLPEPLAAVLNRLATETRRSKSDIVKESVSQYLWEARFRGVRRQLIRRAKRTGVTAEADVFRAV